jgi:hypothetical protein
MTQQANTLLLSIVIPTRNRQEYAANLLRALSSSTEHDFEVIVHDNSDHPSLAGVISQLGNQRIRYRHAAEQLSMHGNFDRAIDMARGEYVCVLGDDDGILISAALAALRRAKAKSAEALITELYSYSWPGVFHRIWGDMGGSLHSARTFPGQSERILNPMDELENLYRRGGVGGLGLLPRVYHGYVARTSLVRLKAQCGTCFPGASPDMANAVGLTRFVSRVLFDPAVTIISGHSPKSGGGHGAAGHHHSELKDAHHLPARSIEQWDQRIPRFWSGTTVYAQSVLEAARAIEVSPTTRFNYLNVCAACIAFEPATYRHHIQRAMEISRQGNGFVWPLVSYHLLKISLKRARSFAQNVRVHTFRAGGDHFNDMNEIMQQITNQSSQQKKATTAVVA